MQHNKNKIVYTASMQAAADQLSVWKIKAAAEKERGAISINTIAHLNRAYMVYKTKLINERKAS